MIQSTDLQFLGRAGVNYLLNPGAETGRQGWSLFTTTFSASGPTTITPGAANCTLTSSTTAPLRGTRSLAFAVTSAIGSIGQGFISDVFTVDNADLAKVLTAAFDFNFSAGGTFVDVSGTSTQTLEIWVYNVGLAAWTQPAGFRGINQNSLPGYVAATFQTDSSNVSNKNQYRIAVIIKNAPSGTFTMQVDQAVVGPQPVVYGAPVTDWQTFTPTGGWTTNTTYTGRWRRVGDSMEVSGRVSLAGAPNAAALIVNLPSGFSIDTSKLASTASVKQLGVLTWFDAAIPSNQTGLVVYSSTTAVSLQGQRLSSASNHDIAPINATTPKTFASGDQIDFTFSVPILGWSSTVQMSNDTDTRVVAASYSANATQALNAATVTTLTLFGSKNFDTHSAFDSATGIYTIPTSGVYDIDASWYYNNTVAQGNGLTIYVTKNGSIDQKTVIAPGIGGTVDSYTPAISYSDFYNAGDTIRIRARSTNAITIPNNSSTQLSIKRRSGPSAIAATESVTGKYENTAGTALTGNVEATLPFATKKYDSHGAFNGTVFTAPISGVYQFSSTISLQSIANTTNQVLAGGFRVTSTPEGISALREYVMVEWGNGVAHGQFVTFTKSYKLNAGDTVEVRALNTNSVSLATDAGVNFFCWNRVGN